MMKLVWKDEDSVIHGKGNHCDRQTPIIDEVSRGTDFYKVELVNAIGKNLAPQTLMPAVSKMIATVILHDDFEPGFGLGINSQGIIERIPVPAKAARYGLGYIPTDDDMKTKKSSDQALSKPIPHMYHSYPVREYVDHDGLEKESVTFLKRLLSSYKKRSS